MFNFKLLATAAFACALATPMQAQTAQYPVKGGVTLRARAYTNHSYSLKDASRFDLQIVKTPKDGYKWDFTFDGSPTYHYTGSLSGGISPTSYNNKSAATLRSTLHQYDIYEERVTFKNLDLVPLASKGSLFDFGPSVTPRALLLKEPVTLTTPSGIFVTLPAQNATTLDEVFTIFSGNANALFFKIEVSPDKRDVILPNSPLYQKHSKPVTIRLETPEPNFMVWSMADNTSKKLALGLPNLKRLQHLDTLTLILRQRVELQTIPVEIEVPVQRPVKTKSR